MGVWMMDGCCEWWYDSWYRTKGGRGEFGTYTWQGVLRGLAAAEVATPPPTPCVGSNSLGLCSSFSLSIS